MVQSYEKIFHFITFFYNFFHKVINNHKLNV